MKYDLRTCDSAYDFILDFMNMTEAKYSGYGLAITYSNIGKAKEIHMQ